MLHRIAALLAALSLLIFAVALGEGPADGGTEGIRFVHPALEICVGKKARIEPQAAKAIERDGFTYESLDESVAKVSKSGRVTAVAPGECEIRVTSVHKKDVSALCAVRVLEPVRSIALSAPQTVVSPGGTLQLTAVIGPEGASPSHVRFESSNKRVAVVDETGLVTGVSRGKVTVKAVSRDNDSVHASIKLSVSEPIVSVSVPKDIVRVGMDASEKIKAKYQPHSAIAPQMTWVSSDPSIASVSGKTNEVTIRGNKWGQCTVTGTTVEEGLTTSFDVHVGNLRRAMNIRKVDVDRNGYVHFLMRNNSNLTITRVVLAVRLRREDGYLVNNGNNGIIAHREFFGEVKPGETLTDQDFEEIYANLKRNRTVEIAVVEWDSPDGFVNSDGRTMERYKTAGYWVEMKKREE